MRKGRRRGACAAPAGFADLPAAVAGSVVPSGAAAQIPEQGVLDLEKGDIEVALDRTAHLAGEPAEVTVGLTIEDGWHTNSDRLVSPVLVLEGHGTVEEAPGVREQTLAVRAASERKVRPPDHGMPVRHRDRCAGAARDLDLGRVVGRLAEVVRGDAAPMDPAIIHLVRVGEVGRVVVHTRHPSIRADGRNESFHRCSTPRPRVRGFLELRPAHEERGSQGQTFTYQ